MKQILQDLRSGETRVDDVPAPAARRGQLLIRTHASLISAGTERMLVEFGKAGLIDKARQQPDKVRMVLDKAKTDGIVPTITAIREKLNQPLPLGYCNVGTVIECGPGVTGFSVGDRVASNGKHAEVVAVPTNLCAKVPEGVPDEEAAFTVLGSIALQGIRLVAPSLGEAVVVTGLGLIGLVTVQLLRAHGCRVLGLDFDPEKLRIAREMGAETVDLGAGADPVSAAIGFSRGRGVDAVIITAATKSNEPVHQAALMCRKRGRIVLVGVTGLELSRADFFEKELTFQVSCSYGPGRYDPQYEEGGADYPVGFVRWTEQRNFEAVLDMIASRRLDVASLISHRFRIDEADRAYELVSGGANSLGIVLKYPDRATKSDEEARNATVHLGSASAKAAPAELGVIGAGNYASAILLPAFKEAGAGMRVIASAAGVTAVHAGRKFGFERSTTDTASVLGDARVNTVVIATRHDTHASLTERALNAGKHVFVEKPLALSDDELSRVESAYAQAQKLLMVGFNRRFAPHIAKMKSMLGSIDEPKAFSMTVNAGAIPATHWTQDPAIGGGRIVGEGCHWVDLLRFLAGHPIEDFSATAMGWAGAAHHSDRSTITLKFADGSIGTVHYFANGHKSFPKETLEVFVSGRVLQMDNFRKLRGFGWPGFKTMSLFRQDKGQKACARAFVDAIAGGRPSPIPAEELFEVSRWTLAIANALG